MFHMLNVSAGYSGHPVLRDVTVRVPEGAVVALLGPNGAGKTTLLRVAGGLLRPSSGTLRFGDADVTGRSPHELARAGICHVPEGRGVFGSLSVRENLAIFGGIDEAVDVFPALGRHLGRAAGTMSGGEQQMLALARAYLQQPKLALLDEVSMGLAPIVVDEIFGFIELLAKQGSSLLLVEQYVSRALEVADYVYLLNRGQITFVGDPSELTGSDLFREYVGADMATDMS